VPSGPLKVVVRRVSVNPNINAVLKALAQDPSTQEKALGLGTSVTSGITAKVRKGIADVTLNSDFASNSSADQLTAVAQIVCTLTAQPGIGQVQFELGGTAAAVPRGDGSSTSAPVSRDDYPQLIPATIR
jgi:spore germination protein GerM